MDKHRGIIFLGGFFSFIISFWVFIHYRRGCFFIEGSDLMCSETIEILYYANLGVLLFSIGLISSAILSSRS
ncbi:MAG: hypothetical protein ACO20H_09095 [Bacteriovoracaceae bacterium]